MALPREYAGQACSIAKALEIVGERWTLLIVRDAAYGVRRFSDFVTHLDIPRRVLTERLKFLVEQGILDKQPAGGREEYVLTDKGLALFPVIRALAAWGDEYTSPGGRRRILRHVACGTVIERSGRCPECDLYPPVGDLESSPGPGLPVPTEDDDPVTRALAQPCRLLEPLVLGK
jgi:DNA-binding HxlR family transcriptional regulator